MAGRKHRPSTDRSADADCARIGVPVQSRGERLRLFCDAYGLDGTDRTNFLGLLRARLLALDAPIALHSLELLDTSWPDWERLPG